MEASIRLIIEEGTSETGLVCQIHGREFPSEERMRALHSALESVRDGLTGSSIDRQLAHALFCLAFHIQGDIDGMLSRDQPIPSEFIERDMVMMFDLIEEILEGTE